jgi:flagellar hook-basal body complex protein FliE
MPIPTAAAANAYASLARIGEDTAKIGIGGGGGVGAPATGPNFGSVLKDVMDAVSDAAQKSDVQSQAVATGKANMVDVVTAVAESETAIQTLVSVRDKVISAYEDILKMPI